MTVTGPDPLDIAAGHWLENLLGQNHEPGPPFTHTFPPSGPEAVITKLGWFFYDVNIHDGLTMWREGKLCLGRRHAERKARRELARYRKVPVSWTITG